MPEITASTLTELKALLDTRKVSAREIFKAFEKNYQADAGSPLPVNGYIEFFNDNEAAAAAEDKKRSQGKAGLLSGLPIAVKDNILMSGRKATCGSHVLKDFIAPYSATVIERLLAEGAVVLGRTNMDEFAMGSSCEHSCYGPTRNPSNREYVPGGSSGGSAAVVSSLQAPVSLGSDTGGSVRLPASFCGIYGLKPTYGVLSRYGLVAYGSSLDQIGILARSPEDIALLLSAAVGPDPRDNTSLDVELGKLFPLKPSSLRGLRFAIPAELMGEGIAQSVRECVERFIGWLKDSGAAVTEISIPLLKYAIAIYYIIAPAEASSNLGRYDGVQYGLRESSENLMDMYCETRTAGFGSEVKRRVFIGNYVLSHGYYDAYYKKAQAVRSLLTREFASVFENYDVILSPTSPTPPFRLGEKLADPLAMYLQDMCTTFANLVGAPALSIPAGVTDTGLPIGIQIAGRTCEEARLLEIASAWEREGERR
jgi:aspartyl-tRNA(Asn)/glutamyl-tRNA(Gln) amidotransferase subunit A